MLDMILENNEKMQMVAAMCGDIMIFACAVLRILDMSDEDQELIQEALAIMEKLRSYGI